MIDRLDDWLQARPALPEVNNPVLPEESFTRKWDQDRYDTFRDKIHDYREWIDDAYDETKRDESIRKWRRVFGDAFAKGETIDRATTALVKTVTETFHRGLDFVGAVIAYGQAALDLMPPTLPHVEPCPHRLVGRLPIRIVAHEKRTRGGPRLRRLQSGQLIERASGIEFQALVQNTGLPFPKDFEISWQVVNTDRAAADADCLRGDFYRSDTHAFRFEETRYRGVHWVQAFLIKKRTGHCEGISDRFFVVIG